MSAKTVGLLLASLVMGVTLTGCVCNSVGCDSGIYIRLLGSPADSFTLVLDAPGMEPDEQVCPGESCRLFFPIIAPRVTVTYESATARVQRTFEPDYSTSRPNGIFCPPVCEQTTLELDVEEQKVTLGLSAE